MKILNDVLKNKDYRPLFFLIFLAFICRLIGIDRGLWNDEQISINTISNNIFTNPFYKGITTNLPLYFYILKIWSINGLFINTIYLRLLGVVINLITLVFLYNYFRKSNNLLLGKFAILLLAITPLQIHYSQEIRPYILTQALIIVHFVLSLDFIKVKNKKISFKFFIVSILLLLTHYAAYLYLFIIGTIILINKKDTLINKTNLKYLSIFCIFILLLLSYILSNQQFFDSFENTGIQNYKWTPNSLVEMIVRIKEVVSSYYYLGLWYYLASPITQGVFKKISIIIFILSVSLVVKKIFYKNKIPLIVTNSFIILLSVMILGFCLEKFGLYPFGGRHIMPYSFFMYIIVAYLLISAVSLKNIFINLLLVTGLISTILYFIFHQSCVMRIAKDSPNIKQENSYSYCINNLLR